MRGTSGEQAVAVMRWHKALNALNYKNYLLENALFRGRIINVILMIIQKIAKDILMIISKFSYF